MSNSPIKIDAILRPDGMTLDLPTKLPIPSGKVTILVQSNATSLGPTLLETLDRIHQDQQSHGQVPMSESAMAEEITAMRSGDKGYEERWQEIWQTGRNDKSVS